MEVGATVAVIDATEAADSPDGESAGRSRCRRDRPEPRRGRRAARRRPRKQATEGSAVRPTPAAPSLLAPAGAPCKASPLARRIARERGVDLASIQGTGPEGRILAEDVERAATGAPAPMAPVAMPPGRGRGRAAHLRPQDDRAPPHRGLDGARLPARGLGGHDRGARAAGEARGAHGRGRREADRERPAREARGRRAHPPHARSTRRSRARRSSVTRAPTSGSRSPRRRASSCR